MATEDARKLFVAGLPESITEDALREIFEATGGKVTDVSLPRDRATGRVRGFGFVTFSSPEEAAAARDALDGSLQAGRPVSVRPFSSEPPRREGGMSRERGDGAGGGGGGGGGGAGGGPGVGLEDRTLYVGNLPYDVTQQEVSSLFTDNALPAPVRTHLPVGPDGRLRGFGFVTCSSSEAANQALATLRSLDVRGRRLMVNIAHPRGERPAGGPGVRPLHARCSCGRCVGAPDRRAPRTELRATGSARWRWWRLGRQEEEEEGPQGRGGCRRRQTRARGRRSPLELRPRRRMTVREDRETGGREA